MFYLVCICKKTLCPHSFKNSTASLGSLAESSAKKKMAATSEFLKDMKDPKYRFAYELVKEVAMIRGETRLATIRFPPPRRTLFTAEHADVLQAYLVTNGRAQENDRWINSAPAQYSIGHLHHLMDVVKHSYYNNVYSNSYNRNCAFICACGNIAYLAAHFMSQNNQAQNEAINCIKEWIANEPEDSGIFTLSQAP